MTWASIRDQTQTLDVLEGENVLLECKFPEGLFERDREYTHYWIRSNRHGHDNVAIGGLQLENNYALDFHPESGVYHLRISNATYDRDNGQFECRMKEGKTGKILHTKSFDLTVLLKVCIIEHQILLKRKKLKVIINSEIIGYFVFNVSIVERDLKIFTGHYLTA